MSPDSQSAMVLALLHCQHEKQTLGLVSVEFPHSMDRGVDRLPSHTALR